MRRKRNKETTALTNWDEALAKEAEIAAGLEANAGGGQFFSVRGGQLSFQDSPLPNNEMVVVILDTVFENVFYEGPYNPDEPQSPSCFAFNHEEEKLAPHEVVVKQGNEMSTTGCHGCEKNEWGSADTGRGKACSNTRRLAMIPAGQYSRHGDLEIFEDLRHYETTGVGFMKLPVTSVKGYANFVKQVAGALKRPPFGVITRVSVVPDVKTQFKVIFEGLDKIPNNLMGAIMQRRKEVMATIEFPYFSEGDQDESTSTRQQSKRSVRARGKRKY